MTSGPFCTLRIIQSHLNSSNTYGSFTMANSNSFLSSYEILPTAEGKQIIIEIFLFYNELYVVSTHLNRLIEAILLMSTLSIPLLSRKLK